MDNNNKKNTADMNTNNKKNDRTEFADEINMKDTHAKNNKQNNNNK